jgi:hypothetical protein
MKRFELRSAKIGQPTVWFVMEVSGNKKALRFRERLSIESLQLLITS